MPIPNIVFLCLLPIIMFACYKAGKLTLAGTLTAGLVALAIFAGARFTGIGMLAAFFGLSVLATSYRKTEKDRFNHNITHPEKRNTGQVLANGSVACILGLLMYIVRDMASLFSVLMAAALASATADTLSSELGTVFGKRFYNIITLKKDTAGLDGVVSLEGTLIGVAGALAIAVIYALFFGWGISLLLIIAAGFTGNLVDSVLGAWLERRGLIGNNVVNFLNTAVGAGTCFFIG